MKIYSDVLKRTLSRTTIYTVAALLQLLSANVVSANTIILTSGEPALIGAGGILDANFGLGNLQRVDDTDDGYWSVVGNQVSVEVVAKYAGYSQDFGYITADNAFTSLMYVTSAASQTATFDLSDSGSPIRFGLDPSGSPLFSSYENDNQYCGIFFCFGPYDHMVSWLITDGEYAGDYVFGWEDLTWLGDRDYNDLVVRVSGVRAGVVPVPAAMWLLGSGLLGLVAVARRRSRNA